MKYEFDPNAVSATFEVFPKDDYEFSFGEPKAFERTNRKQQQSYGVRYGLTITTEGPFKGKKSSVSCYMHSEGGQAMAKQVIMAALGYKRTPEEEQRFNRDFAGQDWSFDPDNGSCGAVWRSIAGKRAVCSLDVGKNEENGEEQQKFASWRPVETAGQVKAEDVAAAYATA
jgi:hypothetical protein